MAIWNEVQILSLANHSDTIDHNSSALKSLFFKLNKERKQIGLLVNKDKTKYLMLSSKRKTLTRSDSFVTIESHVFEVVDNFVYSEYSITSRTVSALKCKASLDKQRLKLLISSTLLWGANANVAALGVSVKLLLRQQQH